MSTTSNPSSDSNKSANQVHGICNEPWLAPTPTGYFFITAQNQDFCRQYTFVEELTYSYDYK